MSGHEPQPPVGEKYWAEMTAQEKAAAMVLGYTGTSWDNESGLEPQPAAGDEYWAGLKSCGEDTFCLRHFSLRFLSITHSVVKSLTFTSPYALAHALPRTLRR